MARNPLKFEAVTCGHCGARVREDRAKCLRCGEPLVAAAVHHERHSARLTTILGYAGAVTAAALIGVVVMRPSAKPPAASRPAPAAASTAAPRAERPASSGQVPPAVAAFDAMQHGRAAYTTGDIAGSIEQFQKAADAQPTNAAALNNLGQVLVKGGRASEALPYFDRAVALDPDSWAYHFNRARAYAALSLWGQAVAGYRDALQLFPDDYATQFNLAQALQARGDLEAAIRAYERAIELAPGEVTFHLALGQALEAAERRPEAVAAYRRYLQLAENAPDADKVKGRIAVLQGSPAPTP